MVSVGLRFHSSPTRLSSASASSRGRPSPPQKARSAGEPVQPDSMSKRQPGRGLQHRAPLARKASISEGPSLAVSRESSSTRAPPERR